VSDRTRTGDHLDHNQDWDGLALQWSERLGRNRRDQSVDSALVL